jgi:hypothetical protein
MDKIINYIEKIKRQFVLRKYINLISQFRKGKDPDPYDLDPKLCFLKGNFYCQTGKTKIARNYYQKTIDIYTYGSGNGSKPLDKNTKDKYNNRLILMCSFIFENYSEMASILKFPKKILNHVNILETTYHDEFDCIY